MKRWIIALGTCAALSTLPMGASAYGYDAGSAALGGLVGGVVGGLIGSGVAPYPVYVRPAPVIVEPYYAPAPVVVERYYGPPAVYYEAGHRGRHGGYGWNGHKRYHGD